MPQPPRPSRRLRAAAFAVLIVCRALAAASAPQHFDLPAGDAATALRLAAQQAGREIMFPAAVVQGVRVAAVRGDFTVEEALTRMLAGTELQLVRDAGSSALAVGRATPSSGPRPATAPGPTASSNSGDDAIALSPFVVESDRDTGYAATSTLAGTRLNTPVKDLGASISIYTKDFLDDIGATNSAELLVFATGMEAAGPGGNFSGAGDDINATQVVGNGPRVDPQQNSRTRGLAAPNFTRGFFTTGIAFDAYNTESVTINRGPNAILFGVGSPAGVVDTSLLRPNLRRNKNTVAVRYGDNDSLRGSVDFNRVLVDRKLALRFAALHDREEFNQRPAFEEKRRLYAALAFEPLRSSSVRANAEVGRTQANRPITVLPFMTVSEAWFAAGRPAYDWSLYDDPARNPGAATQTAGPAFAGLLLGQNQTFDSPAIVYSSPSALTPSLGYRNVTRVTAANAANAVKAQVVQPLVNRDGGADQIAFYTTSNVFQLPNEYWVGANVLPGQLPGLPPAGIKQQGFTDFSAFDFENRMIDETSRQGDSFHAFNVAIEQRAWSDRVGLELAYDNQRIDRRSKNSFFSGANANHIRIDASVTLPTGQPNPNLGRPLAIYGQSTWGTNISKREAGRATGYIKYDFKDIKPGWGKWLGRHTLTGIYEETAIETVAHSHRLSVDGAAARDISPDINAFGRRPTLIVYIGPSIIGNNRPLQLEPIRIPELVAGPTVPVSYFVRAADAIDPGAFVTAPASLVEVTNGGNAQREVIKSQAVLLQSYWLRDHFATVVGWRRDEDYFGRRTIAFSANPADSNDPGKVHYGLDDFTFARTPPGNATKESKSYSGVLRWPRALIKLPGGMDFSVFYNRSENFTPIGGRVNPFGEPQASPQGETREYGFNLSAWQDKLTLRVNWFETGVRGQSFTPPVFNFVTNNAILQVGEFWGVEGNTNPHLAAQRNADIELLFSPLPAGFRQLHGWRITGTAPNLSPAGRALLPGSGDTTDFTAEGTEIELVFNPTRNWRILANVARQETVQTNSLPALKGLIARMLPVWEQLRSRPLNTYPLGWQPGDSLGGALTYGSYLDTNVLVPFATAIATEGSSSAEQRKWRANLVTNYTFDRNSIFGGRLKGWGLGGGVRWQDRLGIGYPSTRNPDGSVKIDLAHPYYAPAETNVDAWVSYERKLWNDRITWRAQLNGRNLYGDSSPIAIGVQPWGQVSTVRLAPERRWFLTNTFSF